MSPGSQKIQPLSGSSIWRCVPTSSGDRCPVSPFPTSAVTEHQFQTGNTLHLFKGHTAPVTSLAFVDRVPGSGKGDLLLTGSWDKVMANSHGCLFMLT